MRIETASARGTTQPFEPTAFVREVVLPGSLAAQTKVNLHDCLFDLRYRRSRIHRWGIFAAENIPSRRRVIEYTGQKIEVPEVWRRRIREHLYIFWLNENEAIDGAIGGSGAEFINHSCDPNLYSRIVRGQIFFLSGRRISAGEELTLDYNLGHSGPIIRCLCRKETCKGIVNKQLD